MKTINMPGFTAEESLYNIKNASRQYAHGGILSTEQLVVPQLMRRFSCAANSSRFCEFMCDWIGGGMTSNPDGSVSCHY